MRPYKGEVYKDRTGMWRWKVTAPNGNKTANCGEGYGRRSHALRMLKLITSLGRRLKIVP